MNNIEHINIIEKNPVKVADNSVELFIKPLEDLQNNKYKKLEDLIDLLEHIINANTIK
jgi:hypothetical protein